MKALINIDFTNDFVNGALPVGQPAIDISKRVATLTQDFIENEDFVVFAVDLHDENDIFHPESGLFPPHNIRGTEGRQLFGEVNSVYDCFKDRHNVYWMDKTRYSSFAGTNLLQKLRERGITEIHLVGVCTDICVLHTAVDAYNNGFKIVVHEDCVASFDQAGHEYALRHFKGSIGADVVKGYKV